MDNFYSVDQLAVRFSVGKKVIYGLIHSGELCARKIGKKHLRISETEVQRWLAAQLQDKDQGE